VRHVPIRLSVDQVTAAWLTTYTSANTRAAYGADLRAFLSWCAAQARTPFGAAGDVVDDYRAERQASGVSNATIARQLSALRAFYSTAERLGALAESPFEPRPVAAADESSTAVMDDDEIGRLRATVAGDPRLSVLVELLLSEGLRLSEALAIDHDDVSGPARSKRIRLVRHGRATTVTLGERASQAVGRLQRGSSPGGPLLRAHTHSAVAAEASERLTRFGADYLIKHAAQSAGIDQPVSANVLRRTHAAKAHHAGTHIDEIRRRMGHRDVRTTRRYIARQDPNQPPTNKA
jgi:site-specific recombinase XerD